MTYIWPVDAPVTQEFGANPNPSYQPDGHTGMDFGCAVGTPCRSVGDGTVLYADWAQGLGWPNPYYIAIDFDGPANGDQSAGIVIVIDYGPFAAVYAHMNQTGLNPGDKVKLGEIIGQTGNTGRSSGPHLHFEILPDQWNVNGPFYGRINPRNVIDGVAPQGNTSKPLAPNERVTGGSPVNQRSQPRLDAPVVRVIPAGSREIWKGWVHGDNVVIDGRENDIWYVDDQGYASIHFFDPFTIEGLTDLNSKPVPTPTPTPPPTLPKYDFKLDFTSLNGITVEKIPAHWDNYGEDFPVSPDGVVLHWWNSLENRPSIDSVISEFCNISTSKSPHVIVTHDRIIQTVSLSDRAFHAGPAGNDKVGIEIDPLVLSKNQDGSYTAIALKIQANVKAVLVALKVIYGKQLTLHLHKEFMATSCSDLRLSDFDITPSPIQPPTIDEEQVLKDFSDWLINEYINRDKEGK